jgi:hypothetical protein
MKEETKKNESAGNSSFSKKDFAKMRKNSVDAPIKKRPLRPHCPTNLILNRRKMRMIHY